jgi:hypothetical protein
VRVETSDKQEPVRLRILDQLGKVVFVATIENADGQPMEIKLASKLAAGLYIAYFEQGVKREMIRLVIKE